jgi:hypothetical protein
VNGSVVDAALGYLSRGWSVIPVRPRSKRPIIAWQRYQEHPPSAELVRHWYERWPDANVAVVTGAVSALVVVDVDPAHGGARSLQRLEAAHGPLPDTLEAVTGGGGRHLYFAHPGSTVHNRVDLAPGIDIRADGGLVVAPPSVHPSGRLYRWATGHGPDEVAPAPLPSWLLAQAEPAERHAAHPMGYWRRLLAEGVPEGRRNSSIASLAGHLFHHQVDEAVVTELLLAWNRARCRPPLADDEVVRTVQSIARLHRAGAR